jgi:hypothetical protein
LNEEKDAPCIPVTLVRITPAASEELDLYALRIRVTNVAFFHVPFPLLIVIEYFPADSAVVTVSYLEMYSTIVSFVIPPPYLQLLPAAVTFNRKVFWI